MWSLDKCLIVLPVFFPHLKLQIRKNEARAATLDCFFVKVSFCKAQYTLWHACSCGLGFRSQRSFRQYLRKQPGEKVCVCVLKIWSILNTGAANIYQSRKQTVNTAEPFFFPKAARSNAKHVRVFSHSKKSKQKSRDIKDCASRFTLLLCIPSTWFFSAGLNALIDKFFPCISLLLFSHT